MRLHEEIGDRFGNDFADPIDTDELFARLAAGLRLPRRFAQRFETLESPRQPDGVGLADMANAESINETVQHDLAPRLDGVEQLSRREFSEAFEILDPCRLALSCSAA